MKKIVTDNIKYFPKNSQIAGYAVIGAILVEALAQVCESAMKNGYNMSMSYGNFKMRLTKS